METLNYWKQFEHTGRVEDYLSYVAENNSFQKETVISGLMAEANKGSMPKQDKQDKVGVNPYAGIHMGNRNDIETGAYRGI